MTLEEAEAAAAACEERAASALDAFKKASFEAAVAIHALEIATVNAYSAAGRTAKAERLLHRAQFVGRVAIWSRAVDRIVGVLTLDEAVATEWNKCLGGIRFEWVPAKNAGEAEAHAAIRAIGLTDRDLYDAPKAKETAEGA